MPVSYTSGQSSYPNRYPTCLASSQRSHNVSSTPCHGPWTSAPLSAHLSTEWECTASQIETPIVTCGTTTHQFSDDDNRSATLWADHQWIPEWLENTMRLRPLMFHSRHWHPPSRNGLPRTVRLNRHCSCLHKRDTSAVYECGAEEQTVDHVVLRCPIH